MQGGSILPPEGKQGLALTPGSPLGLRCPAHTHLAALQQGTLAPWPQGSQEARRALVSPFLPRHHMCWRDGTLTPAPGQDNWSGLCHPQQGHLTPKQGSEGATSCGVMGEQVGVPQVGLERERQGMGAAKWVQVPAPPRAIVG